MAADVVSRGREDSQTFFLAREKYSDVQQEFFLMTNCTAITTDGGVAKIVKGSSREALIAIDYYTDKLGPHAEFMPIAGLRSENLLAGSLRQPRLIKLSEGEEICFHQILRYTVIEKVKEQRTGFWSFLGPKVVFFAVEKTQSWSRYAMFDGNDLRLYETDKRII
ncbi:MAG: hypothetical protein IAF58_02540 [Leptolyngbya sp.]|nr:hypothetical protein [Candidatus Melainabacteria bacterium]